jgi:hypothetical protein
MQMKANILSVILMLGVIACWADAAEVIYEPFDYAAGAFDGSQAGGTGMSGGWTTVTAGNGPYGTIAGGLAVTGLTVAGNTCGRSTYVGDNEMHRAISAASQTALLGDGLTVWFSVLFKNRKYSTGNEHQSLVIGTDAFTSWSTAPPGMAGGEGFGVGYNTQYAIKAVVINGGVSSYGSGSLTTVDGPTYLIAGKITWAANGNSDTLHLFNISDPDAPEPSEVDAFATATVDLDQSLFDTLAVASKQYSYLDEIRFATTFAEAMGRTPDATGPTHTALSPTNTEADVSISSDLVVTFNEDVQAGAGNILIKRVTGGSTFETIDVSSGNVSITTSNVTINPTSNLELGTNYWIEITNGVIEDASGNPFAGLTNSSMWSFTTESAADAIPPTHTALSPVDGATGVSRTTDLTITFDEDVQAGTGNIEIRATSGDALFESIAVGSGSVTITTSNVTINPSGTLAYDTGYYVLVTNGVIEDLVGNPFAGITNSTQWNFTTLADTQAPSPDAMTFASLPGQAASDSIAMTATTATDDSGPVQYFFTNTINADVSGWLAGTTWTNTGLSGGLTYTYQVKARDAENNETAWSDPKDASIFILDPALYVYEGFRYESAGENLVGNPDSDPGETDATGLLGTWAVNTGTQNELDLASGSLSFGDLSTSGNRAVCATTANQGNYYRGATIGAGAMSDLWFSFVVKHRNINTASLGGFAITSDPLTDDEIMSNNTPSFDGFGVSAEGAADGGTGVRAYGWDGSSETYSATAFSVVNNEIHLIVGHISFDTGSGGADAYTLYIYDDTSLSGNGGSVDGATPAFTATIEVDVDQSLLDTINVSRRREVEYDELRVGPTLNSVLGIVDVTAPTHTALSPTNSAADVLVSSDLVIAFDEDVWSGAGDILIREVSGGAVFETISVTGASVNVSATNVTIDPVSDLGPGTNYWVEITNGVIRDLAGNAFVGITNSSQWNFTTVASVDTTPPTHTTLSPTDGASDVSRTADFVITFDEVVQAGTGNIEIRSTSGDALFESIDVGSVNVTIVTSNMTINPSGTLVYDTSYYLLVTNGVIQDPTGNPFAGITNATQWNFTVEPDTVAPSPSTMTFASAPASFDTDAIKMTATTATDDTGPVEYYFRNTSNSVVSGWTTSTSWTNTGLVTGQTYGYQVKARDAVGNETSWSTEATAAPSIVGSIYEPFDYPAGDIDGSQAGGTGFATAGWTTAAFTQNPYDVRNSGLTFPGLSTLGRAVVRPGAPDSAEMHRGISAGNQQALLADGSTLWFSVLVNDDDYSGGNENGTMVLGTGALGSLGSKPPTIAGGSGLGLSFNGGTQLHGIAIDGGSSSYSAGFLSTPGVSTYLILGRIDWAANGSNDMLWLFNMASVTYGAPPTNSAFAVMSADLDQSTFDTIAIGNQQISIIDELRFGGVYHEMMGVEPSASLFRFK